MPAMPDLTHPFLAIHFLSRVDGFTTEDTEEHRGQRALCSVNLSALCG